MFRLLVVEGRSSESDFTVGRISLRGEKKGGVVVSLYVAFFLEECEGRRRGEGLVWSKEAGPMTPRSFTGRNNVLCNNVRSFGAVRCEGVLVSVEFTFVDWKS